MFDFSFGELLLLAVIALLVLGLERLPRAARLAGLWIRKARTQWNAVKAELENEIADEELRRNLRAASEALHDSVQQARALPEALRNDPLATDATAVMTSLDPSRSVGTQDASMESTPTSALRNTATSATTVADAAATSDPATQADHDPAQMSLLDANPISQMDFYRLASLLSGVNHGERPIPSAKDSGELARVAKQLEVCGQLRLSIDRKKRGVGRREEVLLVRDGREAVGLTVGIPKRQAEKKDGPKDDLDKLMDSLDALDI